MTPRMPMLQREKLGQLVSCEWRKSKQGFKARRWERLSLQLNVLHGEGFDVVFLQEGLLGGLNVSKTDVY